MPLNKRLREIMVPVSEYATTSEDSPLKEAVLKLRKVYCDVETGKCTEAGHRTRLVLDSDFNLVGILDTPTILNTLIPEIKGGISEKLSSLELSVALSEGNTTVREEITANLAERVILHAQTRVGDMMLKVRGKGLQADDYLVQGLKTMHRLKVTVMPVYEGNKLVGVLRDSDLFLTVASILDQ
jgi:hypothetical protein